MKRKKSLDCNHPKCSLITSVDNPQEPETMDASTPNIDVSRVADLCLEGDDAYDMDYIDPDRPPISTSDLRKL